MAYQLEPTESVAIAAPRLAAERVDRSLEGLRKATDKDRDDAIHSARKRLKETRAVLRLVRGGLRKATYRQDNVALRDAGRLLSSARDAWVRVATLDKLAGPDEYGDVRRQLLDEYEAAAGSRIPDEAFPALEDAGRRVSSWEPSGGGRLLREGLERTYRDGKDALRAAQADPSMENLHDWRKRVKDLWYQVRLVQPAWPGPLGALAEEAHQLADLLGDDHDVSMFAEHVRPSNALAELVLARRATLQLAALRLGRMLYAEKPKAFAHRIATAHAVWLS
ncbi:MAG: CHAD domain-containing protein [Egibacteraceae bacterium]